ICLTTSSNKGPEVATVGGGMV
ncbi:hypothetical protein A2U01_0096187, partial [Trifolium medium]|nr:hypothetical protein [Trifolium medium]